MAFIFLFQIVIGKTSSEPAVVERKRPEPIVIGYSADNSEVRRRAGESAPVARARPVIARPSPPASEPRRRGIVIGRTARMLF